MQKNNKSRISELIYILNESTDQYEEGCSPYSDGQWDNMYFELVDLEKKTGIIFPGSPTQKVHYETVTELKKIAHNHPMLSLDKTKNIKDIKSFIKKEPFVVMFKLDGLTCSLTYENGDLISAETRGDGVIGEDVLHNAKVIKNIPKKIPCKDRLIVDGEIICKKENFIPFEKEYKNPRNFSAGSIRLLSSQECEKRNLSFVAWELIEGFSHINDFSERLLILKNQGFDIVPFFCEDNLTPEEALENLKELCNDEYKEEYLNYPIDGYVFKYSDVAFGKRLGQTSHHLKNAIALKEYDDVYTTYLKYIEWTMGRTGVLTPVAVFTPIDIDGSTIERASLHNVSIMKEILGDCAYLGEPLKVVKMNKIIPQIIEAGPKHDYGYVIAHGGVSANDNIEKCPICHNEVEYRTSLDGTVNVYCINPTCEGKLINILDHFFGKKGLDIKGISKNTFEKLIAWGWVDSVLDVFKLDPYKEIWMKKPGFGKVSVFKILDAIENGKNTTLEAFISAIGIPLIGKSIAKELANHFETYTDFRNAIDDKKYSFSALTNFGEEMNNSIKTFDYTEADEISKLLSINNPKNKLNNNKLINKNIVITGKLNYFKNRDELKRIIEENGGKVTGSISNKTDILINNNLNSESAKNKAAKERGIPIISEEDFRIEYLEN